MKDGAPSARGDIFRPQDSPGKKAASSRVLDYERLSTDDSYRHNPEVPTTTTAAANTSTPGATSVSPASAASPVSMAHLEQYTDAEWVEPTDQLTGTAVFDATGDKAAMPS